MDFLNKTLAQLSDLFKSMSPGARITAGLLLAVVVVSLAYLFNQRTNGADGYLMGGRPFSAAELPAMEAAFAQAGLSGYEITGNQVRVPRGQEHAYMAALADGGALPMGFHDYLDKAASDADSPWLSKHQREEIIKNAKQRELSLIVRSMAGIENAAVHYETKREGGLRARDITTVSVSVKPVGNQELGRDRVPMIRHLVGSAIGVSPDRVTVVDINGRAYPGGSGDDPISGGENPYIATMEMFQQGYKAKILDALSYVPGVTVNVNVELNKELRHREERVKVDPKVVQVASTEENSTENTTSNPAGGRPGVTAQAPGANQAAALASTGGAGTKTENERSMRREQNVVSSDTTSIEEMGLTPTRVTVAVGVPQSYFVNIWRQLHPTPAGQADPTPDPAELKQIQQEQTTNLTNHVGHLLPKPMDTIDPTPLVTVTTFPDTPKAEVPAVGASDKALAWFGRYWTTLGMIGMGLVSLLFLRSLVRSAPADSGAPPALPPPAAADDEPGDAAGETRPPKRTKRTFGKGPSLRDELVELVQEDPDAAANILRAWIGTPS
jgi:flagellar M-ring protein FliF